MYLKALTIRERALGTFHPAIPKMLEQYAMLLHKMHKSKQAYELEERASNIWLRLKH